MKNITEQEINGKLKEQLDKDKPLDYIDFLIYDNGEDEEPVELWVDMYGDFQTNAAELSDEDDDIPLPIHDVSDILLDLKGDYSITQIEYGIQDDGSSSEYMPTCLTVYVSPVDNENESNITDDVLDSFLVLASEKTK